MIIQKKKELNCTIIAILDRSGSMRSIRDDAIGGFNSFLDEQKKLPGTATLDLVIFNHELDILNENTPLENVNHLNSDIYSPEGMTALLDAIGITLHKAKSRIDNSKNKPDKVIVVIVTDGMENSSKEYSYSQITSLREQHQWEFIFLAANQDAIQAGGMLGIKSADSINFASTGTGIGAATKGFSNMTSYYRSGGSSNSSDAQSIKASIKLNVENVK